MPTGYTHPIAEKPDYTFEQFVWSCARAFGALILMRDESTDAPIPEAFKPDDCYAKWAEEARVEATRLLAMTDEQAELEAAAYYAKAKASHEEYVAKQVAQNGRIRAMRAKVAEWQPPTSQHENLRTFMLEQLDASIDEHTPSPPVKLDGVEWRATRLAEALLRFERMSEHDRKEIESTSRRNAWLKELRESVPCPLERTL